MYQDVDERKRGRIYYFDSPVAIREVVVPNYLPMLSGFNDVRQKNGMLERKSTSFRRFPRESVASEKKARNELIRSYVTTKKRKRGRKLSKRFCNDAQIRREISLSSRNSPPFPEGSLRKRCDPFARFHAHTYTRAFAKCHYNWHSRHVCFAKRVRSSGSGTVFPTGFSVYCHSGNYRRGMKRPRRLSRDSVEIGNARRVAPVPCVVRLFIQNDRLTSARYVIAQK